MSLDLPTFLFLLIIVGVTWIVRGIYDQMHINP